MVRVPLVLLLFVAACRDQPPPPSATTRSAAIAPHRRAALPSLLRRATADAAYAAAQAAPTAEAFDLAADRLAAVAQDCLDPECRESAYAAMLARREAMKLDLTVLAAERPLEPQPIPPRVSAFIDACDAYVSVAPPDDPDAAGASFMAANNYNRYGWLDESLPRFEAIIKGDPSAAVAEYAANLLLDALVRAERFPEAIVLARQLSQNTALLANRPELAATIQQLLDAAG